MKLQLWAGPGVASLWACALDQMTTLRSTVSSVSVRKVISVVFCIHDCLSTIAMWRKLFTSVPAFRALKAPCRTLKSSSRGAERDFFKGKTIQLIYIKLCLRSFMLIWESITIQCMYTVNRDKVMRVFPKFSHFESYYDRKVNSLIINLVMLPLICKLPWSVEPRNLINIHEPSLSRSSCSFIR